ncbi:MAG TPA: 4Fe-4S dicluster domain-containing protein [Longimicrobiales bacterium]|nr:4Fe-4S dicluster domain-containing protein [Longimicrobiales bacterium]
MEAARAAHPDPPRPAGEGPTPIARWAKVIDNTRCIGCHACTTACKSENQVPLSVTRTYVKYVDVGAFPSTRRSFQVTRCNQCADAPCVTACPTAAMFKRADGIVDFDKSICIGCKACIAACPYDAIFINPDDHSAEKCNFCAHRIDVGLEPACVVVCPTEAILVGDLEDPASAVARIVSRDVVNVRRPEKETRPTLFYKGAHQATLDPLGARRPRGGLFMWSEQGRGRDQVTSGHPGRGTSSAEALLSYDIPHHMPWDWRVSLYTWTKGIAAGVYLLPLLLVLGGVLAWSSPLWRWGAPIAAALFLLATAAVLIWDLEHPERFYMVLTRPQWKSWLVRGGFIITAYGAVLGLHLLATLLDGTAPQAWLALAGAPLAVGSAVYTAWLFAQAKGRDLWQNPLLAPHLLVQALLLGAAVLIPVATFAAPAALSALLLTVTGAGLLHLLLVAAEATLPHATAHAALASREMTRGRYGGWFMAGAALVAVGMLAPWLGSGFAVAALVGVFAHEHAYVQAGQSVPLA